ncbi:MAG: hypothetical protein RLZZ628_2583, partial [Bacteroidota bacterium]
MQIVKTHFWAVLYCCICSVQVVAQKPKTTWKTLRQQGANFYTIQDTFLQQNALLLQEFEQDLPHHEGREAGKYNSIIKYNRWANYVRPRMLEQGGNLSALTAGNVRALTARTSEVQPRSTAYWQLLSPNGTPTNGGSGRINAIRVHPTQPNTIFACSPAGGLWRSLDGGNAWTNVTDDIGILGCSDVVFAPNDPNTLYLATGDADASSSYSTGVFKSTNGGTTWTPTALTYLAGQTVVLSRLLINPMDGSILVSGSNGIHRSTNGGQSWQQVSTTNTRELTFSATNPAIVFATLYLPNPARSLLSRSSDGGSTWAVVSEGLPVSGCERAAIAVTPADPNRVYLLIANETNHGLKGLYRSTDMGISFTDMNVSSNLLGWNALGSDQGGQGWYDLALAVSPTNPNIVFTGGVNIWKSVNGGQSFEIATHWSGDNGLPRVHGDIHHLLFNSNTLWVACDGGVFKTPNTGTTWEDKSQSLAIAQLYGFGSSPTDPNRVLMGLQDNGTNLMTQSGSWSEVLGGDGMQCFFDRTNPMNAFASIYDGELQRSSDGGQHFSPIYTLPSGNWVTPWLQDPVAPNTLYAGAKQLFKSTDLGNQWKQISFFSETEPINAIEVVPSNPQILYVSKGVHPTQRTRYKPTIYKTTNGGTNWTTLALTNFPANAPIVALHVDINNSEIVYVGLASYAGTSVYRSTDGGQTWTPFSMGLPQVPANCFATALGHPDGEIFVGTDIGVYRYTNSLAQWESFSQQLPAVSVSKLEIFYPTSKLRAGTYGRGLWESILPGYNISPTVQLTAPVDGQGFSTPNPIPFAATARDLDGKIKHVQFYRQGVLVATDSIAPYEFQWMNPTLGTHSIFAKAVDDSLSVATTPTITITVIGRNDAALIGVQAPYQLALTDTVSPVLQVQNVGSQPLTALTIDYQLDNQAIQTYTWSGQILPQAKATITLPFLRYGIGRHQFKAYLTRTNQVADEYPLNDTIQSRFSYYKFDECADNFEPNNHFATAIPIPVNTLVHSKLATQGDEDFFMFTTSRAKPYFKVYLKDLPTDFDFELYQYNAQTQNMDLLGIAAQASLRPELLTWEYSLDACTYYVRVYNHYNKDSCYTLFVDNYEIPKYDMSIEALLPPRFGIDRYASTAKIMAELGVLVKNKGNRPVNELLLKIEYKEDGLLKEAGIIQTFARPLMPKDTFSLYGAPFQTKDGNQIPYRVYFKRPNNLNDVDVNRANDTMAGTYNAQSVINVRLHAPDDYSERIYKPTDTIVLAAIALTSQPYFITKVEFYDNGKLLVTDSLAPYQFRWMNAPLGRHEIVAKAYNNAGVWAYNTHFNSNAAVSVIYVAHTLDAGIVQLANERDFRVYDSIKPAVRIRNYGSTVLNSFTCSYQLDNQPIVTQRFANLKLATGDYQSVTLPLLRLKKGAHQFRVWVHAPNNGTDLYAKNDTVVLNFQYNIENFAQCSSDFGDNYSQWSPTPIPMNQEVRCDPLQTTRYYRFRTTNQQPHFTIQLDEFSMDYELNVYTFDTLTHEVSPAFKTIITPYHLLVDMEESGTFIVSVTPTKYFTGMPQADCYRLRVNPFGDPKIVRESGDIGIDSILVSPIVHQIWNTFGARIRNYDTLPIPAKEIIRFSFEVDNGYPVPSYVLLEQPLPPRGTVIGYLAGGFRPGEHHITAYIQDRYGKLNRVLSNDTARATFRYIVPTEVTLSAPVDDVIIPVGTPISINAAATCDATVGISKIELYRDSILLTSIPGSSVQFQWQNAPKGMHRLRAKAMDNQGNITYSNLVRIYVAQEVDAGVVGMQSTYELWVGDTTPSQVKVRNFGKNILTKLRVHSRLDNGAENIVNLTGLQLASDQLRTVTLGRFPTPMPIGKHVLTIWTSLPNGVEDLTHGNDTFRYSFDNNSRAICQNFGEVNNDFDHPTPIATDSEIRKRSTPGIDECFIFKTTRNRPQFSVYLDETDAQFDLSIFQYDSLSHFWNEIYRSVGKNPICHYVKNLGSGTYYMQTRGQIDSATCYRLRILTSDKLQYDAGIDSAQYVSMEVTKPETYPLIYIKNYQNRTIPNLRAEVFIDNKRFDEYPIENLGAYSTYALSLRLSGYLYGSHQVRVVLKAGNGTIDTNPLNDTFRFGIRSVSLPQVSLSAPEFVRAGGQITLSATATDESESISKVMFFKNDTLLGTATAAPYQFKWEKIPIGTYLLTASVYNLWQKRQTSQTIVLQSVANIPPQVQWTLSEDQMPFSGYTYADKIPLTATAKDADGSVVAVQFYKGATLIGADSIAPYEYSWEHAPAGIHRMTVKAIDNQGSVQSDSSLTLRVLPQVDLAIVSVEQDQIGYNWVSSPFHVDIQFQNKGSVTAAVASIAYQLDNNPPVFKEGNWYLQGNEKTSFLSQTLSPNGNRQHQLKVWIANPRADENPSNDTLIYRFGYQDCGNNYENQVNVPLPVRQYL